MRKIILIPALITTLIIIITVMIIPKSKKQTPPEVVKVVTVNSLSDLSIVMHCPKENIFTINIGGTVYSYKWDDVVQNCQIIE